MENNAILSELKTIAQQAVAAIKQWCKTSYQKSLQQQAQMQAIVQSQRLDWIFSEIQYELALVLHQAHYPNLIAINSPMDLRSDGYTIKNGVVFYYYTIDKTTWEKFSTVVTGIICQNMNKDINTFSRYLTTNLTPQAAQGLYPILCCGLNVVNIEDSKTVVRLVVYTNLK